MKKQFSMFLMMLLLISVSQAQYKGKYEGWSIGYLFTGSLDAACYKAFTHLVKFGTAVSNGAVNTNQSTSFATGCHNNGDKALLCIGGAGNSTAFSSACATSAGITNLVKSIMTAVRNGGFDGADMDWEEAEESGNFDGNATKVAMFSAFHKEMAESLHAAGKIATAAVCFDWYPNGSQAAAQWEDQANSMTYYNSVSDMPSLLGAGVIGSVPKSKIGVGFGWDTDNEITDPNDILSKCRWAIDNGYGGIMAWDIARAETITPWILDSISHYVTHTVTAITLTPSNSRYENARNSGLFVRYDKATGVTEISFADQSSVGGSPVDLSMFDVRGRLVKTIFHGVNSSGRFDIPTGNNYAGAYIFRLSTNNGSYASKAFVVR